MTINDKILEVVINKLNETINASYTGINETMYAEKLLKLIEETEKAEFEKVLEFFDSAK
jgi:hypothetical protein